MKKIKEKKKRLKVGRRLMIGIHLLPTRFIKQFIKVLFICETCENI